jgi:hypothetical protein
MIKRFQCSQCELIEDLVIKCKEDYNDAICPICLCDMDEQKHSETYLYLQTKPVLIQTKRQ